MGIRNWLLLLALLLGPTPPAVAQVPTRAELQGELAQIETLGNGATSQQFFDLARGRDAESFATLRDALKHVNSAVPTLAAYGAFALYKGSSLETGVCSYLTRQAFKGPNNTHQIAATRALTYFWQTADADLMRVLNQHPLAACRQTAMEPLLPGMLEEGGRSNCLLILKNSTGVRENKVPLIGALRRMLGPEEEAAMASHLRINDTPRAIKLAILTVLSERSSELARIAIERRLEDKDEVVRLRAVRQIAKNADVEQLRRLRDVVSDGSPEFVVGAMLVLAESRKGDPEWVSELYSFTKSQSIAVRLGATRALGLIPTRPALKLLHKLLNDRDLDVRLAAIEQVAEQHQLESVPVLIPMLASPRHLITHEAARALRLLTGQDHGFSRSRWEAWFADAGPTLQLPTVQECLALEEARRVRRSGEGGGTSASFYGLQITSTRLCFVLDTSGSMASRASGRGTHGPDHHTTRMEVAKLELKNALNQLLDGVRFNYITFDSVARAYKNDLTRLDSKSRKKALDQVEQIFPAGETALFDGLRLALKDEQIDTIYLLTDGVPTKGELVSEQAILNRVAELTIDRKIQIHGVAIGQRSSLLKALSDAHGGFYTEIL